MRWGLRRARPPILELRRLRAPTLAGQPPIPEPQSGAARDDPVALSGLVPLRREEGGQVAEASSQVAHPESHGKHQREGDGGGQ